MSSITTSTCYQTVFVDPQLLLDKISGLVKHHYKLRHTVDTKTAAIGGEWREFRNEGCITLELLKKFPEHYNDIFTPADFLKLLNDHLIVTQFIGINKYFMPCLLRTMESQEVDQYRVTSSISGVALLAMHSLLMQVGTAWCFLFLSSVRSFITEFLLLELVSLSRKHNSTTVLDKKLHQIQISKMCSWITHTD